MIKTRCKFQVNEVARQNSKLAKKSSADPDIFTERVRAHAVYADDSKENQSFAEATPSGNLEIYVNNPAVIGTFEPGDYFYLDIIPVPAKA